MQIQKDCNVYLISDSSGETVSVIFRSLASQLPNLKMKEFLFPLVKTFSQIDEILQKATNDENGIILCTIINQDLLRYVKDRAEKNQIKCNDILDDLTKEIALHFDTEISYFGRKFIPNEDNFYYERMHAINFTISHDDGQMISTIGEADIIILGISRTSKTPTSIYLANRGLKVANIPIIKDFDFSYLDNLVKNKFVIALYNNPERLMALRKQRMKTSKIKLSYIDYEEITKEAEWALNFYRKLRIPVIDVTDKAIEESAALILQHFNRNLKKD
jgi:regulator of PEP synthase PpsR (kinase-PPPase family)